MYLYSFIYICIHTYSHTHTHTHTHIYIYMCVCTSCIYIIYVRSTPRAHSDRIPQGPEEEGADSAKASSAPAVKLVPRPGSQGHPGWLDGFHGIS